MIICRCERCMPRDPAPTYTEAFKLECLARTVLDKPLPERRAFLADWQARHGAKRAKQLKDEMTRIWGFKVPPPVATPAMADTQRTEQECMA